MKKGDYQTHKQAENYHRFRFEGGLSLVDKYEGEVISAWIKGLKLPKDPIFLDVGAGTGRIIRELIKFNPKKIYAVDVASAMLDQLSKNYKKEVESGLILPIVSSSEGIHIGKNIVDLATSLHLFKHLSNPRPTIVSISENLKPKGYFIFDLLNRNSIVRFNLQTCYAYLFPNIEIMLKEEGFKVKEVAYLNNFGETIYRVIGKSIGSMLYLLDKLISKSNIKSGVKC